MLSSRKQRYLHRRYATNTNLVLIDRVFKPSSHRATVSLFLGFDIETKTPRHGLNFFYLHRVKISNVIIYLNLKIINN